MKLININWLLIDDSASEKTRNCKIIEVALLILFILSRAGNQQTNQRKGCFSTTLT